MPELPEVETRQAELRQYSQLPVIALGEGITLLQVLRLLAEADIPSYAVCPKDDFVRHSRLYRTLPQNGSDWSPTNLAKTLRELDLKRAVLLPCSDEWLLAVSALPDSIANDFPSCTPRRDAAESLVNKWRFADVLERTSVPHPRTRFVDSLTELARVPDTEFRDAFLKPVVSLPFCVRYRVKGFRVQHRDQALGIMRDKPFPIMLQEFIQGPPTGSYFLEGLVDQRGQVCGMMARRRLRMFPSDLGNSTLSVTIPLGAVQAADESLRKVLAFVNYRGVFDAEFKYDQRDGLYKLLEINARPWWYVEFAAHCGLDVCTMAYRDALGMRVEPVTQYPVGRRCVYPVNDIRAWWRQHGSGLWSWIRPWSGADETPFHWDDPAPALAFLATALHRRK